MRKTGPDMQKTSPWLIAARVIFTFALIACIVFIFSNSMQIGDVSETASGRVLLLMKKVFTRLGMPGAANLAASPTVKNAIAFALEHNRVIGAICAAPGVILANTGALSGKNYTCFPGFEVSEGNYTAAKVERDGNLVTGNGPAAAAEFAAVVAGAITPKAEDLIRKMYK